MAASKHGWLWLCTSHQINMQATEYGPYQVNPAAFASSLKALQTTFLALKACEATRGAWELHKRHTSGNVPTDGSVFGKQGQGTSENVVRISVNAQNLVQGVEIMDIVVKTIKAASFVVQCLQFPGGGGLMNFDSVDGLAFGYKTAKFAVKGVKVSKKLLKISNHRHHTLGNASDTMLRNSGIIRWFRVRSEDFGKIMSGFRASFEAWNAVGRSTSIVKEFLIDRNPGLVSWGLVLKSYKASKNLLATIEALDKLQGGMLNAVIKGLINMKGAVKGVVVAAKAMAVSKEVYILLIKGFAVLKGSMKAFQLISENGGGETEIRIDPDHGGKVFYAVSMKKRGGKFLGCTLRLMSKVGEHPLAEHASSMNPHKVYLFFCSDKFDHLSALLSVYRLSSENQFCGEAYPKSRCKLAKRFSNLLDSPLLSLSYPIIEL